MSITKTKNAVVSRGNVLALIRWPVAFIVALALLASAIGHINNPYQYLSDIHGYQLLPKTVAIGAAMTLPFLHLTIAICLMLDFQQKPAFAVCGVLFILYGLAQCSALARGLETGCGCFSFGNTTETPIDIHSIGLTCLLALICVAGFFSVRDTGRPMGLHSMEA